MPPRSRNFDGCWTCRLRRIKCDRAKPNCDRCVKAGIECKGYAVILSWGEIITVDGENQLVSKSETLKGSERHRDNCFLRRKLELVKFPRLQTYELFDALSRAISRFDDVPHRLVRGKYFYGPFGAFDLNSDSRKDNSKKRNLNVDSQTPDLVASITALVNKSGEARTTQLSPKLLPTSPSSAKSSFQHTQENSSKNSLEISSRIIEKDSEPRSNSPFGQRLPNPTSRTNIHESSIFSKTDNAFVHYKLLDSAKLTILAIKGPWYRFTEQGMYHILYPKFFANVESDDWTPNICYLDRFFKLNAEANLVIFKPFASALMALSAINLTFIRVSHPNCCWDTLVVPKLKALLFELVCEEFPKTGSWKDYSFDREAEEVSHEMLLKNIKFCILCMVFAISRFDVWVKRQPVKNPVDSYFVDDDLKISIELRKFATNYLNYHLDEFDSRKRNVSSSYDWYENYFLLALILQIHLDNSFGVYENFDLIYAVGECLADLNVDRDILDDSTLTPLEKYLREVFKFFYIFYASTQSVNSFNYSIPEKDQHQKYRDLEGDYDLIPDASSDGEEDSGTESLNGDSRKTLSKNSYTVSGDGNENEPLSFTVHFNKNSSKSNFSSNNVNSIARLDTTSRTSSRLFRPSKFSKKTGPVVPKMDTPDAFVSLGLPESLINLFQEVVKLTNDKRIFNLNGVTPRNYPRICAETKDKIRTWDLENHWKLYDHEYDAITNSLSKKFISKFHEGLSYNVECFYHALCIYFDRLILEVPIEKCQEHVKMSLCAMENLTRLNGLLTKTIEDVSFTCSFWPLLVCGSDIDLRTNIQLRAQCEQMWKNPSFQKYNYWRSKQILFEVWNRQEQDGEFNGFMAMVREWDIVLNL